MASPFYLAIKGQFVIVGKEPDGDSVRFIADNLELYEHLHRNYRIKPSRDGSVQLRFEGIDATEVHYGGAAQPLGTEARDQLLDGMGFENIQYKGNRVLSAQPDAIPGFILSQAADANGRPISYVLLAGDAKKLEDGDWNKVDAALLKKTLNFKLLNQGLVYYTVYTSTPLSHRKPLREAALAARKANRGIWAKDATEEFTLVDRESIVAPEGQVILPKLFRRSIDYLKAVDGGFRGNLQDWLIEISQGSRKENDRVLIRDAVEVKLSDLIEQRNSRVVFKEDILNITFVEK
jgi:endonuclease YncB( thermonuclease family)